MNALFVSRAVGASALWLFSGQAFGQVCAPQTGTYPVEVWRQSSQPGSVPEKVDLTNQNPAGTGMPTVCIEIDLGLSSDPVGSEHDPAYAPAVKIRSDTSDPGPTDKYWKSWWVFRPDGLDIARIDFDGDPSPGVPGNRGREYRLTIGKVSLVNGQVVGALWPDESEFDAESFVFPPQSEGLRHINFVGTNGARAAALPPLCQQLGSSKPLVPDRVEAPNNGTIPNRSAGSFAEYAPGCPNPLEWYNCRVRAAVSGDFGSYSGNDIVRLEARRIVRREIAWMGSRPGEKLSDYLPTLDGVSRGEYLNAVGSAVTIAGWEVLGNIGIVSAGSIGDDGLPLGAEVRRPNTNNLPSWDAIMENWAIDGGDYLDGPERGNQRPNTFAAINQTGLRFDEKWGAAEIANRLKREGDRKFEIREISTALRPEASNIDGRLRTSGNIEIKDGVVSRHGSIGRIEARERLGGGALAYAGTIEYMIGRGGVGGWQQAQNNGGMVGIFLAAGYGGTELTAGRYDGLSSQQRGADIFTDNASYRFFGEYALTYPAFFDGLAGNTLPNGSPIRVDGGIVRVVATRRNGDGGNFAVHDPDGVSIRTGGSLVVGSLTADPFAQPGQDPTYDRVYIENDLGGTSNAQLVFTAFEGEPSGVTRGQSVWIGRNWTGGRIGGSSPEGGIGSGTEGLAGQILVNRRNIGGLWLGQNTATGAQDANIWFTSDVPPQQPFYYELSAAMGGGASGVAPFRSHREDSIPENFNAIGQSTPNTLGLTTPWFGQPSPGARPPGTLFGPPNGPYLADEPLPVSPLGAAQWLALKRTRVQLSDGSIHPTSGQEVGRVRIRFYGPIEPASFEQTWPLVAVEYSTTEDFSAGIVDVTERFRSWIGAPAEPAAGLIEQRNGHPSQHPTQVRDVIVKAVCGPLAPGYYRVVRWEDRTSRPAGDANRGLRCKDVVGTPPVYPFAHYFRLDKQFRADVAGPNQGTEPDGDLTADDIIVFYGWYFASDPRADVAGANQSVGADNQWTADDIIVFLGWYFSGAADPDEELTPCNQPILEEEEGSGESMRAGSPMAAPASATGGETAQRIAALQAMIAAEANPQRRAALQTALSLLQAAPAPQPVGDDR